MRHLILVTCTYNRQLRIDFMRRHIRSFISRIDNYTWIVVEDGDTPDPELETVLAGWNTVYLQVGPTRDKGNIQRNLALEYIRDHRLDGIVYSLDDDNLAYPALADELRKINKLGVVPIGNLGPDHVERPVIRSGRLDRWNSGWADRKYPIDMGAFGFDSRLILDRPSPIWDHKGFAGETEFIDTLIASVDEIDFSPCHWNHICLVFHNEPL